ncbi:histidine kinase [Pseudomonas fulva]|nr:histidine kinase [Pseudomonas fulva]MBF8781117.1 histidine kinase [Pseudomonas fulva]
MTERASLPVGLLPAFMEDAQRLLERAQDCLLHLVVIDNDPDACLHLTETLDELSRRAAAAGLAEVASFAKTLGQQLQPACLRLALRPRALPVIEACLTHLAWQLELLDPHTGLLNLDTAEQVVLLEDLADSLGQREVLAGPAAG